MSENGLAQGMRDRVRLRRRKAPATFKPNMASVLDAIADPIIVIDQDNRIGYVNTEAQQFFQSGMSHLQTQTLCCHPHQQQQARAMHRIE